MENRLKKYGVLLVICLSILGCGEIDEIPEIPVINEKPDEKPETKSNPLCNEVEDFENGTLYKPVADGGGSTYSGNPVFLISNKFERQFARCEVELKDGRLEALDCVDNVPWTQTPFSCFSNGNRQTWRLKLPASRIKNKAKITCYEKNQACTWQLGGSATNRYE